MKLRAIAFDTGGTVLDWHSGVVRALREMAGTQAAAVDAHGFANDSRRRTLAGIVGQQTLAFNMDDVHRSVLDESLTQFGLDDLDSDQRHSLWRAWYRLVAWPDFPAAMARMRRLPPVVSFTMLPTALVVDVSRKNALTWDAIVSCEMIGVYKPHEDAYLTAARWLAVAPAEVLMVACRNFDLKAAHRAGFRTAFVRRPDEWGPAGPPDPEPDMAYDFIEDDFRALTENVAARLEGISNND